MCMGGRCVCVCVLVAVPCVYCVLGLIRKPYQSLVFPPLPKETPSSASNQSQHDPAKNWF